MIETIMNGLVAFLNFQPFGNYGVMNPLSIRIIHILGLYVCYRLMLGGLDNGK